MTFEESLEDGLLWFYEPLMNTLVKTQFTLRCFVDMEIYVVGVQSLGRHIVSSEYDNVSISPVE